MLTGVFVALLCWLAVYLLIQQLEGDTCPADNCGCQQYSDPCDPLHYDLRPVTL